MESREILIVQDGIVAEDKSLYRFGVKQGTVKCFKPVSFNHNTGFPVLTMEKLLLPDQVGDFRIDGNDRIGKLEHIGQSVDKGIIFNQYIPCG